MLSSAVALVDNVVGRIHVVRNSVGAHRVFPFAHCGAIAVSRIYVFRRKPVIIKVLNVARQWRSVALLITVVRRYTVGRPRSFVRWVEVIFAIAVAVAKRMSQPGLYSA